jgi:cytosine/adenosine deaminase-related metal-dependent hydrolase
MSGARGRIAAAATLAMFAALVTPGATRAAAQAPARWSVETPTGPSHALAFDAHAGTLMSLAVAPDGRSLAFDLLGSIYEVAVEGGTTQHGLEAQLGSLEVGKLADLVVLEANPLDDIANVGKIRYVVKNGMFYAGADAARVWPQAQSAPRPYFLGRD